MTECWYILCSLNACEHGAYEYAPCSRVTELLNLEAALK